MRTPSARLIVPECPHAWQCVLDRGPVVARHLGRVLAADLTEGLERVVRAPALFQRRRVAALGLLLGQRVEDQPALVHRPPDLGVVAARGVVDRLALGRDLDPEAGERSRELVDEAVGVGGQLAERVRDRRQWHPDVAIELGRHAGRDLAQPVVVVPRVQVHGRQPAAAQRVGHQVGGEDLAQVAHVDRARGRDPGRAHEPIVVGCAPARLDVVGQQFDPVARCRDPVRHLEQSNGRVVSRW